MKTFNLFVYGTLMKGFHSHSHFIPQNCDMEKGKITGNLYHYPAGFPMVEVFVEESEEISGTFDYGIDMLVLDNFRSVLIKELPFNLNYGKVYGELYKIPFNEEVISMIDSYEGFDPDNLSYYTRTLVPVQTEKEFVWAWVYNVKEIPKPCIRILSGDWRDCFVKGTFTLRPEIKRKQY